MFVFLVFLKNQDHLRPGFYLFAAELHQKNYLGCDLVCTQVAPHP